MDDDARLAELARELADAVEQHLAGWMLDAVRARAGSPIDASSSARLVQVADSITGEVRRLLDTDIDVQSTTPLSVIRRAVGPMTEVLRAHGVGELPRDLDARRLHPDDVYDLAPASFGEIHPDLHLPGLSWGAAKAHVHLSRRRAEGVR